MPTGPRITRGAIPMAWVIRSMTMASSMMPIPATTPRPISLWVSPTMTSSPRPPAPTSPAMITTDNAIMIVWLMPSRIDGRASGSCTLRSSCHDVAP